jgi:hypothetical protein
MTDTPPAMFQRPTDPCQPLPPLRSGGQIARMHTEWARLDAATGYTSSVGDRLRVKARSAAARVTGSADRHFLADLVRAVDAVAARCDELSERVGKLEVVADDLARILGEEITQLRAAVERMADRESGTSPSSPA